MFVLVLATLLSFVWAELISQTELGESSPKVQVPKRETAIPVGDNTEKTPVFALPKLQSSKPAQRDGLNKDL